MNDWIVSKFGGSSVKDGNAMLRCSNIIENNPKIRLTIISATYNTTNQLETFAKFASLNDREGLAKIIDEIKNKHETIARELFSSQDVYDYLETLYGELISLGDLIITLGEVGAKTMDQIYSLGERMSSIIFSDLLKLRIPQKKIIFFDARRVLKTNSEFNMASPQLDLIKVLASSELMPDLLDEKTLIVTQGFIGEDLLGQTTTLGREGSDYSAALFGEAIDASLIQIWTDVAGIASADPRIVDNTKFIEALSYEEATSLATLGAKVLFPRTLLPAQRSKISVFVGSSLRPEDKGTMITSQMSEQALIKAVTVQTIEQEHYLSFVGSHLEKIESLNSLLLLKINAEKNIFIFHDFTSVSITFKFNSISNNEAMKIGHSVLSTI